MQDEPKGTLDDIGLVPRCYRCQSERVAVDAWACWNRERGDWELENTYDDAHCHQCEESTKLDWSRPENPENLRVRDLNDTFRRDGRGNGTVLLTQGVQGEGQAFVVAAVDAVRKFSDFSADNDPWGEHDFGAVEIDGQKVFWKIDCYALDLKHRSENPANEALTHRVLTIMLASEY